MELNQIVHGFKVERVSEVAELEATAYFLVHQKTKAELLWLKRDDDNKTFSIAFKTIPTDDTGVFHILEHSVLNGSERFPLKEPFVDLLKGSLQTFLNAMTFPDKTVYPVASRNHKDFINLTRVYLDAVFKPMCKKNENIFRQEGWHYELKEANDQPTYKGVVYNEMKGAYSSADRMADQYLMNELFPDNCYQYSSGGDPKHIPDLTYEQFCASHDTYYHPTNSMIFLDGDVDIDEMLQIINDEYLSKFDQNPVTYTISKQQPVVNEKIVKEYAVVSEDDLEGKTICNFGYVLGNFNDYTTVAAMQMLTRVLAENNESLLPKAIISKGLAEDVSVNVENDILQPYISITAMNTDEDKFDEIKETIEDVLKDVVKNGIDKELLTAILNKMDFANKERDYGYGPKGLFYDLFALSSWNYGGDPLDGLTNDEIYKQLRENINTDYFEKLIENYILNSNHHASVIMRPVVGLDKKDQQEVADKLAAYKKSLSSEEVEKLVEFNKQFFAWQLSEDSEEVKAMLPKLELTDIDEKPQFIEKEIKNINGVTTIVYPSKKADITYVNEMYRINDLTLEEISYLSLLKTILGDIDTEKYDIEQLTKVKSAYLGSIGLSTKVFSDHHNKDKYQYIMILEYSYLKENQDKALDIADQLINHTLFNDGDAIMDIIKQAKTELEMDIVMSGHVYGMRRVRSALNEEGVIAEYDGGYSFYQFIKSLLDQDKDNIINNLKAIYSKVFNKQRMTLSIISEDVDTLVNKIINDRNSSAVNPDTVKPLNKKANEGIVIASGVGYGEYAADITGKVDNMRGQLAVVNKILSLDYLWNTVRAQGGAYGVGATGNEKSEAFYSYRDPKPLDSIETYKKSSEYLRKVASSDESIEKYIIGTIGDSEPILTTKSKMQTGNAEYFSNYSYEDKSQTRKQILSTTKQDMIKVADILDEMKKDAHICVVASKEVVESCKDIENILTL